MASRSDMHRTLAEVIEGIGRGARESTRPEDRKLAADYLAALGPLLASAVLGRDILRELSAVERMFRHTRLIDDTPFREALEKWSLFRAEYETWVLSAMTVNERLHALGTLESFDQARAARDKGTVERLLKEARVDSHSIMTILKDL